MNENDFRICLVPPRFSHRGCCDNMAGNDSSSGCCDCAYTEKHLSATRLVVEVGKKMAPTGNSDGEAGERGEFELMTRRDNED